MLMLDDVANRLHVSRRTVERLVKAGRIRVKHVGRLPLVSDRELEAYMAATDRRGRA